MKDGKDKLELKRSSLLAALPVTLLCLLLGVLAAFFRQRYLAGVLLFLFALTLAARIWGFASARRVSLRVSSKLRGLFPGEEVEFQIEVQNKKLLPVLWLDIFCPLSKSLCLVPEDCRKPDEWEVAALEEAGACVELVGERRLPLFLWYETTRFTSRWQAKRRGVYSTEGWRLRTGDGFGLTQVERLIPREDVRRFFVYPKLVPVSPELFLRNLWNADTGARGVMEDPTVIRSTRDYMTSDSLKRINWRLAARGLPLTVNLYEDILPRSVHFMFDGESFNGPPGHADEMEEALSILASELVRLSQAQIRCGLSLCMGAGGGPVNCFHAESPFVLLQALAAYEPMEWKRDAAQGGYVPQQPVFDEAPIFDAAPRVGRFYYIAFDTCALSERALLRRLGRTRATVLTFAQTEPFAPFETVCLKSLYSQGKEERSHA